MNAHTAIDAAPSQAARPARPRSRRWRRLLTVVVLLALAGGGVGAYMYVSNSAAPQKAVSTVLVRRGDVTETVLATGTLEARSLVSVGAQVSGMVKSINVALGDTVKRGDVVAEIDSLDQENALKRAQAALLNIEAQKAAEEANLAKFKRALERAKQLNDKGMVAESDYDTATASVAASTAQIAALDAQIETAKLNVSSAELDLSRTRIAAPSAGTVVAVLVDQGQTVNANQSTPTIVKIADLDTMQIKAQISEADVTRVKPGQKVYFTILGDPDRKIEATLTSVEPAPTSIASDSTTTSSDTAIYYNGIFEVPNPDHLLRIDMTAQVTIVLSEAQNVLTLPVSVLGPVGPGGVYSVQVYDPATGTKRMQEVKLGLNNKVTAEVVSGLAEGDRVIGVARSATDASGVAASSTARRNTGGFPPPPGM